MKKTFKLNVEGKHPDRVLEAVKHEIRKYIKRQRRVPLPEGVDFWDFDCRFGTSQENAAVVHFATITALIDAVAKGDGGVGSDGGGGGGTGVKGDSFYLELLAKNGVRKVRAPKEADEAEVAKEAKEAAQATDANGV